MQVLLFILFGYCLYSINGQGYYRGEFCKLSTGETGFCELISNCNYAIQLLHSNQRPITCGFEGNMPIVCCRRGKKKKTENVSQKKCIEYQKKQKIPEEDKPFFISVFGGTEAKEGEFPHMALLGFGQKDDVKWLCGGSLISEQFILTAAHCIAHPEYGRVQFVRLGETDFKVNSSTNKPTDFEVRNVFQHPEYKSASHYHDIALLKLDRRVEFTSNIKPACLFTNMTTPSSLTITGWGQKSFLGDQSSHLLKATVFAIDHDSCKKTYAQIGSKLQNGILNDIQICAGTEDGKDTCPGDSGGPLQQKIITPESEHFSIVGITSFGRGCGIKDSKGVYTRVAHYVRWIEGIVWS